MGRRIAGEKKTPPSKEMMKETMIAGGEGE